MSDRCGFIDKRLADELYLIVAGLIDSQQSKRDVYSAIRQMFNRVADVATRPFEMAFSGVLPRVDFLLKKLDSKTISPNDAARVHSLRYRLSRLDNLTDEFELPEGVYLDDLATLARWIEILSGQSIPISLSSRLPGRCVQPRKKQVATRSLRFILDRVDGQKFVGRLDDGEMTPAVVNLVDETNKESDFSYLLDLAEPGNLFNLVNPATNNDSTLSPEIIIYEPDHLVDISSVAECFTSYGVTAMTNLLNKISPEKNTRPILLGLFAGQLLDRVVNNHTAAPVDYNEAVREFFASAALRLASCDDIDMSFHNDARQQLHNIEQAVRVGLESVDGFDRSMVLLEPSFFCEMLGLQGRMDMLQTDFSILVEQKSGKGAWGSDEHGSARPVTSHFVQLLLYHAVLHYGFDVKGKNLSSFLLYSKYPVPLVRMSSAPGLLFQAFRVRNEIAFIERQCAVGDWFAKIAELTPENLNKDNISGSLWNNYVRPQLESVLAPIQTADSLARLYVERMLKFVAMEHSYAKTGFNGETFSAGFSGAWNIPPGDKKLAGDLCDNLTLTIPDDDGAKPVEIVRLLLNNDDDAVSSSNFRRGDIVVLYSYRPGQLPDIRRSIVIRASVVSVGSDSIELKLRAPQSNRNIFRSDKLWAIEHDFLDSSLRQLYRGVYALLSATPDRRAIVLGQLKPRVDESRSLIGEYGQFNDLVLRSLQACDIFMVIGPPGAGKTSHGLMNILDEHRLHGASIIAGAYTNRAVDEICARFDEAGLDYIRIGSALGCADDFKSHLLETRLGDCKNVGEVKHLLTNADIVVGTVQSLSTAASTLFTFRRFDLAIIDEASQILEPHLAGLLSSRTADGRSAISKFVFIGDHCQLPAVVMQPVERSRVDNPSLHKIGLTDCRISFFERMLRLLKNEDGSYSPQNVFFLERQGRMHLGISDLASSFFYDGKLDVVPLPHQIENIPQLRSFGVYGDAMNRSRLLFIDVTGDSADDRPGSNACHAEAKVIADIAVEIYHRTDERFNNATTLGVIVPYRSQISAVKSYLAATGLEGLGKITVDTVERFQGSQRDYIIYGFSVRHLYQMSFMTSSRFIENGHTIDRKLNVAITRARSHLVVVGNSAILCSDPLFARFIDRLDAV